MGGRNYDNKRTLHLEKTDRVRNKKGMIERKRKKTIIALKHDQIVVLEIIRTPFLLVVMKQFSDSLKWYLQYNCTFYNRSVGICMHITHVHLHYSRWDW
jgi:hypothetical protein